jgi:hypothetical protein
MQITRLLLLALLPALATAQTAELAMQLADGSTLLSDPVGLGGGCTNCGVLPVRRIGDGRGGAETAAAPDAPLPPPACSAKWLLQPTDSTGPVPLLPSLAPGMQQSYALTTDRAAPPLLVAVSGAFSNAVLLAAYGSKDCTGPNSTSLFYEFTSDAGEGSLESDASACHPLPACISLPARLPACLPAVSIDTDSEFPSQINSFVMCVVK